MASNANPRVVQSLFARDGRVAAWVHAASLGAAGFSMGLVHALQLAEETGSAVLSVGLAACAAGVLWSLVLTWRAVRHGGRLGVAVWFTWLALTEAVCCVALLGVGDMERWWEVRRIFPVSLILQTGCPAFGLMLWIGLTLALPCGWWWMRRRERGEEAESESATEVSVGQQVRSLTWRTALVMVPYLLVSTPVAVVLCAGIEDSIVSPALSRSMPEYAQRLGLRIAAGLGDRYASPFLSEQRLLADRVVLDAMADPPKRSVFTGNSGYAASWIAESKSREMLEWAREFAQRDSAKSTYSPSAPSAEFFLQCLHYIARCYSLEDVREFLRLLRSVPASPATKQYLDVFVRAIWSRDSHDQRSLRPDIEPLLREGKLSWFPWFVLLSGGSTREERRELWAEQFALACSEPLQEERAGEASQRPSGIEEMASAMARCSLLSGGEDTIERLLAHPSAKAKCEFMQRRPDAVSELAKSRSALSRLIQLTSDPDQNVRRASTQWLSRWPRLKAEDGASALVYATPEDASELEIRTRIVEAAREVLAKMPESKEKR